MTNILSSTQFRLNIALSTRHPRVFYAFCTRNRSLHPPLTRNKCYTGSNGDIFIPSILFPFVGGPPTLSLCVLYGIIPGSNRTPNLRVDEQPISCFACIKPSNLDTDFRLHAVIIWALASTGSGKAFSLWASTSIEVVYPVRHFSLGPPLQSLAQEQTLSASHCPHQQEVP